MTLHDGWTLRATAGSVPDLLTRTAVPATVPGCVHADLRAAGVIPDPYVQRHEAELAWMHDVDWRYRRSLTIEPAAVGERVDLVFDGLDTVASVRLGDVELGRSANMHRSVRYDVTASADGVARDLVVDLASATSYALAERERLGERPGAYPTPYPYVRKMACSFGWDWGPDLRSAGIWRPVRLERWHTARLARVRPLVSVEPDGTGVVEVRLDLVRADHVELVAELIVAGVHAQVVVPADADWATVAVRVPDVPLWWPAGYGPHPLVDARLELHSRTEALDFWTRRLGFRTVELDTSPDEHGSAFLLKVNGRPVFVRGANWIPDDHLVAAIPRARLAARLDQALGAHVNLLRVWGGGLYESDDFYDLADERGLLVWQDFPLACAAYPEEQPLWDELAAEARENVARLMPHPSLVIWNGGNENLWGHEDWGWVQQLAGRTWGERYARELFAQVVAEVDPTRPYTDNSPCSPGFPAARLHPNDPDHGTHHQWEVWNRLDYTAYRDEVPRFCSEFGFQGPPAWATLDAAVRAEDGRPLDQVDDPWSDPVWRAHQKAEDGDGKLDRGMAPHVGVPAGFTDWLWAAQLVQARAVRYAVEHYRSWWPRTAGCIVWQLNDCWPVTSWSAIDGAGRLKPVWFALRTAYAPRALAFVRRGGQDVLALVNDTDERWAGTLTLNRQTVDGDVLACGDVTVAVGPRSVLLHPVPGEVAAPGDPTGEAVVAELDGIRAVHTVVEDVDLRLDRAAAAATVEPAPDGYRVHVSATSLVRDLVLMVDRAHPDATADTGLLTLPAGTDATLHVTCPPLADPSVLVRYPVLRTANDLRGVPQRAVAAEVR